MIRLTITILCAVIMWSCEKNTVWYVTDFGAVGDSTVINTKAIQSAIDKCHSAGGGRVVIAGGDFFSGTILLKDNVTLEVAEGAQLLGSPNPYDYETIDPFVDATGQTRGKCLIGSIDAKNVAIVGKGTINGCGEMFTKVLVNRTLHRLGIKPKQEMSSQASGQDAKYLGGKVQNFDRPFLLRFVRTDGLAIRDVNLKQPAAWTVHLFQCTNFIVDGVSVHSHANKNNDGIDIDSSSDGIIQNCNIDSGDDAICFKSTSPLPSQRVVVRNCTIKSDWGALKFGTESMGDYRDIKITNCLIHDTRGGGIKMLSVDGADISNIIIDSIQMQNVDMPVFIRLGERRLTYRDAPQQAVGTIDSIRISNITASTPGLEGSRLRPPTGIFITGTPDHQIGDIWLENINITLPGGGVDSLRNIIVPENETLYPEFTKFGGALPAYGLMARHVKGLKTTNVNITLLSEDAREEVVILP